MQFDEIICTYFFMHNCGGTTLQPMIVNEAPMKNIELKESLFLLSHVWNWANNIEKADIFMEEHKEEDMEKEVEQEQEVQPLVFHG